MYLMEISDNLTLLIKICCVVQCIIWNLNGFDDLYLNEHVHIRWAGLDKWNINLMKHVHCTYEMSLSRGWWDSSYVTVSLSLFLSYTNFCVCVCVFSEWFVSFIWPSLYATYPIIGINCWSTSSPVYYGVLY